MIGLPVYTRRKSLKALAAEQSTFVRGLADNSEGRVAILFCYETESSAFYFTTGYFDCLREAVEYSRLVFLSEDIKMNIFKNTKLFPNIKGVMLKGNRTVLTMNGKVNITEMRGGDARAEIFFDDHEKTAVINRNQLLEIADVYGPETTDWKGKPVALYGEEGEWFGKHQWGLRVDAKATRTAWSKAQKNGSNKAKPNGKVDPVMDALLKDMTEIELEMISKMTAEEYNEYRVEMGSQPLTAEELEQYSSHFLQPGG